MGKGEKACKNKGEKNMQALAKKTRDSFTDFLAKNRAKIIRTTEANSAKTKKGIITLSKEDSWRNENEWDEIYKDSRK
ncbi:hypothetical protein MFMK1_001710 [Metallumcola ferriviriculae]|uniref:Uncharacterized protein n=1 Tax=Metallumcola ferriviriculae TaxID=3039180 RepID=A0AAU0UPW6_9FIRM|nr:hypothetical protein MFMK1_001710 [Desulfitibacteraceae bacterium MK1]